MIKRIVDKLRIVEVKHLSMHLGSTPVELAHVCSSISRHPSQYYRWWNKCFPNGKTRPMVEVRGRLREILDRLNDLLQHVCLPEYVNGGVPGRSVLSNAMPHLNKPMLMKTDLANHFPRVSPGRVYAMFRKQQECSPEVARILTRLTTQSGGLPQGSPTSVAVSNLVTLGLSRRLRRFAEARGAVLTQYVDDYIFSGGKRLAGCKEKIISIVKQEGFKANEAKTVSVPADKEQIVTGIRVNGSQMDAPSSKVADVRKAIRRLRCELEVTGSVPTKRIKSIEGKISYIAAYNRGTGKYLRRQLDHIKTPGVRIAGREEIAG
ncbi:MAG: RNA-directed DNA polymerase [Sedimentisphaerales bacterium]|nr:RNA-directed DNA polymerase [Sedimentisphaerales bacterium]